MKKFTSLVIAVFGFSWSFGQEIEWQKTLGGSDIDIFRSIQQTSDGGYILGGTSSSNISGDKSENSKGGADYWVVKTDNKCNIQWQKTIGGNDQDGLTSIQQTSDGGYIIGGFSRSNISGDKTENSNGQSDFWIVKLGSTGNILWQNTIGGNNDDALYTIHQTSDGGYIVGGISTSDISGDKTENHYGAVPYDNDYWVLKLDVSGNIQWQNTIAGNSDDRLMCLQQTSDSGYILGGKSKSDISVDKAENTNGYYDDWILKIDASGNIQWQNTIGGIDEESLNSIQQTSDRGYILGGYSASDLSGDKTENSNGGRDYWIVKIDSSGKIQWQKTIGGNLDDFFNSLSVTSDGGYMIAGYTRSDSTGDKSENCIGNDDYWLVKIDSIGDILWQNTIGGNDDDELSNLQVTSDNDYIIGGTSYSNISGDKTQNSKGWSDFWLLKLTNRNNSIIGKLFIDLNSNSIQDSIEPCLTSIKLTELNTNTFNFSNKNGFYQLNLIDSGQFSVIPETVNYYMPFPSYYNTHFSNFFQIDSLNDFAFQPIPGINDLQISIAPLTPFRSGFDASYLLNYKNVGTTTLTASVAFYLDATNYTYSSSGLVPSLITPDSVIWNNITLTPWQQGSITVTVHVNAGVPIGTYLSSYCIINPIAGDNFTRNNYSAWNVSVTGSYDPNNKSVSDEIFTTKQLADSSYLDYIICFQNTGNDTAINVSITDSISPHLNILTFQLVSSSYPLNISYKENSRFLKFDFDSIYLPDSSANEQASHGFINYRIRPVSTLAFGDTIKNTAFIYFDFNQPVQTNWTETSIVLPIDTIGSTFSDKCNLYPNPVSDILHIDYALQPIEKTALKIFDVTGRIVYENKNSLTTTQINVSALSVGVYIVQLSYGEKKWRCRFVKN